jgi:hypothetical protein
LKCSTLSPTVGAADDLDPDRLFVPKHTPAAGRVVDEQVLPGAMTTVMGG